MHFQVKMEENGRKNILREKKTIKKVLLMFLDVKVITENLEVYTLKYTKCTLFLCLLPLKREQFSGFLFSSL